ncbi:hypothetical protein G7054_g894 [Neopestalotiopsis clavispora]|nr:hypothetical protein G7054_g894 [Neopestalotiopsis clavispora]
MDFITTVLGDAQNRNIDWLTIHPRTRSTPSRTPISVEALEILTEKYGRDVPILVSGDVFTLSTLPYTSHLVDPAPTFTTTVHASEAGEMHKHQQTTTRPNLPNLRGLMSARALLANPALFAGHETCPWEAVDVFLEKVARAPLPLKLAVHHLGEMTGPGYGPDKKALLGKKERMKLVECSNWIDVLDTLEELRRSKE